MDRLPNNIRVSLFGRDRYIGEEGGTGVDWYISRSHGLTHNWQATRDGGVTPELFAISLEEMSRKLREGGPRCDPAPNGGWN